MALINGMYIHAIDESLDRTVKKSTHSVEQGIDITDTVKPQPISLSLQGKIVNYSAYVSSEGGQSATGIKAWISLVKRNGSKFDRMSFERLNGELLAFENGVNWVDTGNIRFLDENLNPVPIADNGSNILEVRFEVSMPYEGKVRIQNAYKDICAFNIINKSTTGYTVRDYWADADALSDIVLSNTYNNERGRVCTEFTNLDVINEEPTATTVNRSAAWVIEQLNALMNAGALIKYEGRNILENYQISDFHTGHPNTVTGGATFTMTIVELRTASNSYSTSETADDSVDSSIQSGGVTQISTGDNDEVWYTTQPGDTVWGLVEAEDADYKDLKRDAIDGEEYSAMDWVMAKNPTAFSVYGDFTTMQDNVNILLGMR